MQGDALSDFQLYGLVVNPNLNGEFKAQANKEFDKRDFSQEYIDELSLKFEEISPIKKTAGLTAFEIFLIIAIPFFIPIQSILANRHISKGNINNWKLYWKYLTVGWLLWT